MSAVDLGAGSIIKLLRKESNRLERLRVGLDALDRDVRTLRKSRLTIWFCVDFHNLRQYLASRPLSGLSGGDQRLVSEEYVSALLFHALPKPLVLLPSYYDEFLSHVKTLASGGAKLSGERDLWLRSLRTRLHAELTGGNGLLAQLESQSSTSEDLAVTIEELKERVLRIVFDLDAKMNKARQAVVFLERFDHLFRSGKLVGLREVLQEPERHRLKDDKVYWRARHFFDDLRPSRELANENDARALSLLYQINRIVVEKRQICMLVSSADAMPDCVATLNDQLIPEGERIELRDLEYWLLWFNLVHEADGDDRIPSLEQIDEITKNLSGVLGDLQAHCDKLLDSFLSLKRSERGRASGELVDDLKSYLERLNNLLVEISRPILGGKWLSAELEREFVPVAGEKEFFDAMKRLLELVKQLESPGFDVRALRKELEDVLRGLESVLVAAEADAWKRFERMLGLDGAFVSGLKWDIEGMGEPYATLLRVLEKGGRETADVVAKRCLELRAEGGRGYEGHVIASKAYVIQGRLEEAIAELESIGREDQARPSVQLVKVVILKEKNELEAAEDILKDLEKSYRDPIIALNFASLFALRFQRTGDVGYLGRAITFAEAVAESGTDNMSVLSEAKVLLLKLRFLRAEQEGGELRGLSEEVRGLRRELEGMEVAEAIKEALWGLEGEISAKVIEE